MVLNDKVIQHGALRMPLCSDQRQAVGDCYSDVCPARAADQVFAKEILYEKCIKNGTPCLRYDDFGDIRRSLEKNLAVGFAKPA